MISVTGDLSDDDVVDRSAILTHVAPGLAAPGLGTADLLAVVAGGMGGRSSSEHNTNTYIHEMLWTVILFISSIVNESLCDLGRFQN